jgi:WD40 repeat protein
LEGSSSALLCSVAHHSGHVHVVRWSKDGRYFASGSVDGAVHVYTLSSGKVSFGNVNKNKEHWVRIVTLQGHSADVLDLDWSVDGHIASASVDNNVIIWDCSVLRGGVDSNSRLTLAPMKILQAHKSFVKGVAFDPVGHYLISCSEDGTLVILDCDTWKEISRIEGRFQSSDRSIFSRMSWAPDGNSFCVSSGRKSSKPVGSVLKRDTWLSVADLVGHDKESMCCRFLPCLLNTELEPSDDVREPACVVAIGDLDGKVSVWSSGQSRPVLVLEDLFTSAVTDLAWITPGSNSDANGCILGVCSLDGYFCAVVFGSVLGNPINDEQQGRHFVRLYGRNHKEAASARPALVADPALLQYTNKDNNCLVLNNTGHGRETGAAAVRDKPLEQGSQTTEMTASEILALQQKSRTKDGKKRIRPVLLESDTPEEEGIGRTRQSPASVPPTQMLQATDPGTRASQVLTINLCQEKMTCSIPLHSNAEIRNMVRSELLNNESAPELSTVLDHPSIASSVPYSIFAERLRPPDVVRGSANAGGLCPVLSRVRLENSGQTLWEAFVAATVSSVAAVLTDSSLGTAGSDNWSAENSKLLCGLAVVGCLDGSIHFLSLACGARLCPPLICGHPIAFVDVRCVLGKESESYLHILACCIDGELIVWRMPADYDAINCSASSNVRNCLSGPQVKCVIKTSLRPAVQSMRCQQMLGSNSIEMKNAELVVESCCLSKSGQPLCTLHLNGAQAGNWQTFAFSPDVECWIRVADLRHAMSRYILVLLTSVFTNVSLILNM